MTESESEFHVEEYKELRKEVLDKITKAETMLQYGVVISAAVFSWLATHEAAAQAAALQTTKAGLVLNPLSRLAWWIPFAATVVIGMIGLAQYIRIKEMGKYLKLLESALGNSELGWEKFLARKKYTVSPVFALAWLILFLGTGCIAIFVR